MGRAGILTAEDRVELLDGEVIVMSPIGNRHAACVDRLTNGFTRSGGLAGRALVRVQNPLAESNLSEPQPDLMLLIPRDDHYDYGHPRAADVLLLVEVADSSLDYDMNTKVPFYARAGIREVWIVDLAIGSKSTASPRVGDTGPCVATCPEMRWHRPRFPT